MIIFDLDGTLWDTREITLKSANIVAAKYPDIKEITMIEVEGGMGYSFEETSEIYMPYLDKDRREKYFRKIIDTNIDLINKEGTKLYEGVKDTIINLSKDYKLGIVTNNNDNYVKSFFKSSGLEEYFTDYMGAASYNLTKGEAIKKLVSKYNEKTNYYVGDIKQDMISSEDAGVTFIHAKYGFDKELETKYFINDIRKLPELMKNI